MSRRNITLKALLAAVAAALVTCFVMGGCADDGATENSIVSVELNKKATDISFEMVFTKEYVKENKGKKLYLFEFEPHESTSDLGGMTPVKEFKIGSEVSLKIPFIDGNDNRLYSKFAVAEKLDSGTYKLITGAKYPSNVEVLATNTESYPAGSTKKGLAVQMFSDAQQLGVAHTVINVPINEYMYPSNSEKAISFHYNGQTFYLDKNLMAILDHKVKTYSEAGINVYLNFLLSTPTDSSISGFYYDNISPDATYYALNTKNETSMKSFRAFADYVCARYTDPARTHGFVPAIIVGFEVNSNSEWNNVGSADLSSYIYSYCTAFRVAYTAMRSHYSEGMVYISLGNNFNYVEDPGVDFPAEDFLSSFNAAIKNSGDMEWGLSVNIYPTEAGGADYWNDAMAQDSFDTPFITMKNIDTLTEYMSREAFLYASEPRSIIIGEYGLPGNPADNDSMTLQAAAYALSFYTVSANEHIDALIYSRHIDNPDEYYHYGLWTGDSTGISAASMKKPIYNVFALIDTDQSEAATSFVKQTVGTGVFGSYLGDNVKYKNFEQRTLVDAVSAEEDDYKRGHKKRLLFDLTGGSLYNFYPSDSVSYIELKPLADGSKSMLYAGVAGVPTEYKGISNTVTEEEVLKDARYISMKVMVAAPVELDYVDLSVRLKKNADAESKEAVYNGETRVKPNEWNTVSFDIKELAKVTDGDIDMIKLWIRTPNGEWVDGEYGIWLENAIVYTKGGMPVIAVIFLVLLGLIALAVAAYGVLFIRAQLIRKKRREERERMRREYMMRQGMTGNQPIPPRYPSRPPYGRNMNDTDYRNGNYR